MKSDVMNSTCFAMKKLISDVLKERDPLASRIFVDECNKDIGHVDHETRGRQNNKEHPSEDHGPADHRLVNGPTTEQVVAADKE